MSEQNPEAVPDPKPVAAAPPAVVAPKNPEAPDWLPSRLEQAKAAERTALLAELGISDLSAAKAAIEAAKAAEEAAKSDAQKRAELQVELDARRAGMAKADLLIKEQAENMLASLLPEHRDAILKYAGTDPSEQLRAIKTFGPTWKETLAAPANTSAAPPAPASGAQSPPDAKVVYETTRQANPFRAAAYGLSNPREVYGA